MLKKTKGSQRIKLRKKLDKVHSQYIRYLYGSVCVVCGSTEKVGCGHVMTRSAYSTRWDTEEGGNCYPQCWACNYRHEFDAYPYFNWFLEKYGKEKLDRLHRRHKALAKYKSSDLESMIANFEGQMST